LISRPSASKKMMPGGPNSEKRLSSALSCSLLAVTSACSNSIWLSCARTFGSEKVNDSISLHETHQSA